ncbi:hypothetical protein A1OE_1241 [Candidatus Endolissoclinum faulkneri L2]|uniref:Uncharacterized protein n=1 Tax=Candidatus Endolissoclinum faulkneri L2 TaxID=1193729 RepID=K7YIH7_9PROT|nr:hypothetical protein A1OE_1241 [Candidatus Endolissoclinum faulkneri L2]
MLNILAYPWISIFIRGLFIQEIFFHFIHTKQLVNITILLLAIKNFIL